jgi:hypothetical protein
LEAELKVEYSKIDRLRARKLAMYSDGTHTRAKSTTLTANIDMVNDRIQWLRSEIALKTNILLGQQND